MFVPDYHGNNIKNSMEKIKIFGLWLADALGISVTTLAIFHFTVENVKSIILFILSAIYLFYKILDSYYASKGRQLDNEAKQIEVERKKKMHQNGQ